MCNRITISIERSELFNMQVLCHMMIIPTYIILFQMALPNLNYKSTTNALNDNHDRLEEMMIQLKTVLSKDPLSVWMVKDRYPTMSHLHANIEQLNSCIKNKMNKKLENLMTKVFKGEDIQTVVFGGSNSAGGGLQEEEHSLEGTFFNILNHWWRKVITPITGSRLNMKAIAIGGTSSRFFQFCYKVYLMENNYDLVLLELSVNEARAIKLPNVNQSLPLEQFIRQLMSSPNNPVLLFVNFFYTFKPRLGCLNLMDLGQGLLCDRYKITTFNLRDSVCDQKNGAFLITSKALKLQAKDRRHTNLLGHAQIAWMMINVISVTLMKIMANDNISKIYISRYHLPRPVYIKARNNMISHPLCWTTLTPNYKTALIHDTLNVSVVKYKGFVYVEDVLIGGIGYPGIVYRTDAYSGWEGEKYGFEITIAFTIVPEEEKSSLLSRSVGLVSRTTREGGVAEVWLNDDYNDRVSVNHRADYRQTNVHMIAVRVSPGEHTLTTRIVKHGLVSFIGIVIGPPDGPY